DQVQEIGKACSKYAGRINFARMPVVIRLIEVGPTSPDQQQRLGAIKPSFFLSKILISGWAVDTGNGTVWTTAGFRGRSFRHWIEGLLQAPREEVVAPEPVAVAPRSFPWLTAAMIAALAAIFAAEIAYGVGTAEPLKQPTVATLIAFGGLSR